MKNIWKIEENHLAHYNWCEDTQTDTVPYISIARNATDMVAHSARLDTKDKMPGPSFLRLCHCVTEMAKTEARS